MNKKILVLRLGNEILSDDGVGIATACEIRKRLTEKDFLKFVDVEESSEMGISLLDCLLGYEEVVLIDSIQMGTCQPGTVHEFSENDLKILHGSSLHYIGIAESLALGRSIQLAVPSRVKIFAVEIADSLTVSTKISQAVCDAIPSIVSRVVKPKFCNREWNSTIKSGHFLFIKKLEHTQRYALHFFIRKNAHLFRLGSHFYCKIWVKYIEESLCSVNSLDSITTVL